MQTLADAAKQNMYGVEGSILLETANIGSHMSVEPIAEPPVPAGFCPIEVAIVRDRKPVPDEICWNQALSSKPLDLSLPESGLR